MRDMGMTRMPTSMSATASDLRKKLVAFCSFFSKDTARITRMFPPMVSAMMTSISSAGQFFSFIAVLVTESWVKLSTPPLMAAAPPPPPPPPPRPSPNDRVWLRSRELLLSQAIRFPSSRDEVVVLKPPSRVLAVPSILEASRLRRCLVRQLFHLC